MRNASSAKRKDNRGRILKTGESQTKEGKYVYKCTVRGEQKFAYSWRLNETDPLPKGKKAKPPLREIEKEFKESKYYKRLPDKKEDTERKKLLKYFSSSDEYQEEDTLDSIFNKQETTPIAELLDILPVFEAKA